MARTEMTEILKSFTTEPLFDATGRLLAHLGVRCTTPTEEPLSLLGLYAEEARAVGADVPASIRGVLARVDTAYFVGTVDDGTLVGKAAAEEAGAAAALRSSAAKERYEGLFVFAVRMKPGAPLGRADAATLVRAVNRLARQNPATVLILEGTALSVATCERSAYRQAWRPGERLGKVSILKGVDCLRPHRGHLDILESMNVRGARSFDALYAQWKKVFSTSLLTNKFYNELFGWYVWAIDPATDVYFPNDPDDDKDDDEGLDTKVIRLITRIMFVWFIRQKQLVPDWIFDEDDLKRVLKDFDPLAADSGNYYNAVLQNLFFATLNRAVEDEDGKRRFAELEGHVDAKNLYRYDELFTISKEEIVDHFASVPFVNGSLFECLDKTRGNDGVGKAFYYDGFSRNGRRVPGTSHFRYRAFVPNRLFFDPERGLFSIFGRYSFTVEENTPLEQQVALDPELLGKVFENLLGVYNPETKETARKKSGSFYTPREIVDYMVDQSLISYLGDTKLVRSLFSEGFVYNELDWAEYQSIAARLKTVKVLDPACGSGAFPVGMLNRIVEILGKLKTDGGNVFKLKRHIIENCIYGSDIQCIAAQITKLRFFISLIVNCEKDAAKPNFGIPELPNLETKFVAANSLVGVAKIERGQDLFENPKVVDITEELRRVRHDHFNANTAAKKRRLVRKDAELRQRLSRELDGNFFQQKDADKLARWNPYDQNVSAPFFDPEWMFGVRDGFDIVIGNPPYGATLSDAEKACFKSTYVTARTIPGVQKGSLDTYTLFIERGFNLLSVGGVLDYIVPISFTSSDSLTGVHRLLFDNCESMEISSYAVRPEPVFENAVVNTSIVKFCRTGTKCKKVFSTKMYRKGRKFDLSTLVSNLEFANVTDYLLKGRIPKISSPIEISILKKVFSQTPIASLVEDGGAPLFYRTTGGRYFKVVTNYSTGSNKEPQTPFLIKKNVRDAVGCILSSNLAFWFYQIYSNNLDWKRYEIESFTVPAQLADHVQEITTLYSEYLMDIESNANTRKSSGNSRYKVESFKEYKIGRSKKIIDCIDDLIGPLYGLTQEEIDFVKNYEVEFRLSGKDE